MTNKKSLIESFRHGGCYSMAIALHQYFGWRIGALIVDVPNQKSATERWPHPVHAYVISPDGDFLDAGGLTNEGQLKADYLDSTHRKFWDPRFTTYDNEADFREFLHRTYAGPMIDTGLPGEELEIFMDLDNHLNEQAVRASDAISILELDSYASLPMAM